MSNQHLLYLSASSKTSDNPALSQSDEELIERFDRLKRSVSDQGSEETLHSEEVMKITRSRHFNVGDTGEQHPLHIQREHGRHGDIHVSGADIDSSSNNLLSGKTGFINITRKVGVDLSVRLCSINILHNDNKNTD